MRALIGTIWISLIAALLFWPKFTPFLTKGDQNTLHIFSWGDNLNPNVISRFEKEYKVKVKSHGYTSNEEMLAKMRATGGKGYDLIIPSDYAVKNLAFEELIKPINKNRLNFYHQLDPFLLGHDFDPKNHYSIPILWDVIGFGVDTTIVEEQSLSFKDLLDEPKYRIAMTNDPIEILTYAIYHLFGPQTKINEEQKEAARTLLKRQKPSVEAYVNWRGDYLLSTKNCAITLSLSSYILRLEKELDHIKFAVPSDHTFIAIENIVISSASDKDDLIYLFLNYLYRHDNLLAQTNHYYTMPPIREVIDDSEFSTRAKEIAEAIPSFHLFRPLLSEKETRELWIDIKS